MVYVPRSKVLVTLRELSNTLPYISQAYSKHKAPWCCVQIRPSSRTSPVLGTGLSNDPGVPISLSSLNGRKIF